MDEECIPTNRLLLKQKRAIADPACFPGIVDFSIPSWGTERSWKIIFYMLSKASSAKCYESTPVDKHLGLTRCFETDTST